MARIEIAFSEELGEELSAIEANERWIEGKASAGDTPALG